MSGLPGKGAPTVVRTETPLKLSVAEHRNPLRLVVIPSVILRKASEQHKNEMHKSNWCKIPKTGNTKISTVLLWNPPFWKPLLTPNSTIPPLLACPLRLLIPRASGPAPTRSPQRSVGPPHRRPAEVPALKPRTPEASRLLSLRFFGVASSVWLPLSGL